MEFFSHQTDFKFMATRHVWYGLSAILMVASIVMIFTRGLNFAIDFTGGVSAQATFPVTADLGAVRNRLVAAGFRDPQVQAFGS
ncbi:MAG: protein translocase subunit SecF, partial [Bradyrhizobium sp.]